MTIRDRGKKKWLMAYATPELTKAQRDLCKDSMRNAKPIIDVYELEEFDQKITYSIENNQSVKITIWEDGFTFDIQGRVHDVDSISHQLRIEEYSGNFQRIAIQNVVGVAIVD